MVNRVSPQQVCFQCLARKPKPSIFTFSTPVCALTRVLWFCICLDLSSVVLVWRCSSGLADAGAQPQPLFSQCGLPSYLGCTGMNVKALLLCASTSSWFMGQKSVANGLPGKRISYWHMPSLPDNRPFR